MQLETRVVKDLSHAPGVEILQALAEALADVVRRRALLAGLQFVMLVDVVVLQAFEPRAGIIRGAIQAGCSHAPCANRRAHQVDVLAGLRQPVAKNILVQRAQDQAFGAARCTRNGAHIPRLETVFFDVLPGSRASVDAKRLHV